ncbi:hypothetical protein ACRAWD_18200 [Caulobacter segnis]
MIEDDGRWSFIECNPEGQWYAASLFNMTEVAGHFADVLAARLADAVRGGENGSFGAHNGYSSLKYPEPTMRLHRFRYQACLWLVLLVLSGASGVTPAFASGRISPLKLQPRSTRYEPTKP